MLYFRAKGVWLLILGVVAIVLTVVFALMVGQGWLLMTMAGPPLIGFGGAMAVFPGQVEIGPGVRWEGAWQSTPMRFRALWLTGLLVGCVGSMLVWMWLIPYVSFE